jgi:hypothetical protein
MIGNESLPILNLRLCRWMGRGGRGRERRKDDEKVERKYCPKDTRNTGHDPKT